MPNDPDQFMTLNEFELALQGLLQNTSMDLLIQNAKEITWCLEHLQNFPQPATLKAIRDRRHDVLENLFTDFQQEQNYEKGDQE